MAGEKRIKPTIFLIGDSTVKNGSGKGDGGHGQSEGIDVPVAIRAGVVGVH